MALKADGDKVSVCIVLTKRLAQELETQAAALGLNKSAYIRQLIAREARKQE